MSIILPWHLLWPFCLAKWHHNTIKTHLEVTNYAFMLCYTLLRHYKYDQPAFCLTRFWIIRFKWIPLLVRTSSSPSSSSCSSLSSSPLSSAGPGARRCVGRAGRVWRTGRQRPPTSSQPCPSGEGWCFRDGDTLDTPSSWRGGRLSASGGRQINDLFFILFHFAARASAMVLRLLSP